MASAGAGHSTVTPACNRALQKKWEDRKFKEHRDRLNSIKPSVDNGRPRNFVHIRQNLKKQTMEQERQGIIQKHNKELLSRMQQIMSTTGRVEHRNMDWKPKKSLGYLKRASEMERITKENQRILKRIQGVRPQYSVQAMDTDFLAHKTRAKSLSIFPPIESPPKLKQSMLPQHHSLPLEGVVLPPIPEAKSSRPDTHASEIKEEIEVDVDN